MAAPQQLPMGGVNPMFSQNQAQQISSTDSSTHNSDTTLVDPITKCKELLPQLKTSLLNLMQQLVAVLTPNSENKNLTENQFQTLGKYVENFDRVCDLLTVNLRVAYEVQQVLLLLQYFERIDQRLDPQRIDPQKTPEPIAGKHVNRIVEIRNSLQKFLAASSKVDQQQNQQQA